MKYLDNHFFFNILFGLAIVFFIALVKHMFG